MLMLLAVASFWLVVALTVCSFCSNEFVGRRRRHWRYHQSHFALVISDSVDFVAVEIVWSTYVLPHSSTLEIILFYLHVLFVLCLR